nr:uncharacterized protein LOC113724555 [Coffea arabica]
MKVAVWNCRGAGGPLTIPQLKEVIHLHSPSIVFLCETKNQETFMKKVRKRVKFENGFVVSSKGRAGELALFWKEDVTLLDVQGTDWYIEAREVDKDTNEYWWMVGIYASTEDSVRKQQRKAIEGKKREWGEKWVLVGDFNDICSNGEKWGGRERSEGSFRDFNSFISGKELVDIGYEGVPWTWSNTWEGKGEIKERLDRCLGSVGWVQMYEKATCEHVEKEASDHCLLILDTTPLQRRVKRRFYFDQRWAKDKTSHEVIKRAWGIEQHGSGMFKVARRIKECRIALIEWNRTIKGNTKAKIQELKEQLKALREAGEMCNKGATANLKLQLSKAYKEEELYWSQKSRSRWLKEGDKNTAYFHLSVMAKRKRNRISMLQKTNGELCRGEQEIEEELNKHYTELFTSTDSTEFDEVLQGIPHTISNLMNEQLIKPVDEREIKQAIFSMFPNKAPGVDGFSNLLKKAVERKQLTGIKISKDRPMVSHLFFADDSLLCCKASKKEALKIKEIIQQYGQATGQVVNFDKSAMFFARNTPIMIRKEISEVLDNMREAQSGKYLGLPMTIGRAKNQVFGYLKNKIHSKLQDWKHKMLSQGGKEILIKSVIMTMPNYIMSCFKLPKCMCKEISARIARFWWGVGKVITKCIGSDGVSFQKSKGEGGLGFRDLEAVNLALLAKQIWRIITNPNLLVSKVLKAKYMKEEDWLEQQPPTTASWCWKSMHKRGELLQQGLWKRVGDGRTVKIWQDEWIPGSINGRASTARPTGC